jgi:hypothetical protein
MHRLHLDRVQISREVGECYGTGPPGPFLFSIPAQNVLASGLIAPRLVSCVEPALSSTWG